MSIKETAKEGERKVYKVLIDQIWNILGGYCWAPRDLRTVCGPFLLSETLLRRVNAGV